MRAIRHRASAAEIHPAWELLDDASQVLARAEALVLLLSCARDLEEHHACGAEMARELLAALRAKLFAAQDRIRSSTSASNAKRG
ncbi:hypothetical protein SNE35_25725 [Paucibacter sp. R3-3]|uniref:Uncharacterized protein n=1 Tax=Roseateles agri TaxID=3098619 RepID=A0ABU5DSB5_9BURK|nr:hypothetical protein [Paucibacter sp. R3-3]MDY0747927.1 hypothetical protein [Paucibacter sp. R3-3]